MKINQVNTLNYSSFYGVYLIIFNRSKAMMIMNIFSMILSMFCTTLPL